ncbi:MAG: TolC family protein, partial [Gemmatimonadota bacterium]
MKSGRKASAAGAALVAVLLAGPTAAQAPPTLTLDEALALARANSPAYLATRNDEDAAAWGVRESYAGFLPQASVSAGMSYDDGGTALFGSFTGADIGFTETPSYYFSRYSAVATWTLSPQTWFNVTQQRATLRAVALNVGAAATALEADVKRAYLFVLRSRDQVELRRQRLARAEETLALAETRAAAGVVTPLDAKQARV